MENDNVVYENDFTSSDFHDVENENHEAINNQSVLVRILNQDLTLKIDDTDISYLETVVKYINDTTEAIKEANPHLSEKKVLILCALNIADMLHRKQSENDKQLKYFVDATNHLHEKSISIIDILDSGKNINSNSIFNN